MRTEVTNTRLTIDLPSDMHRIVKVHASLSNLTIKDFIIEAIDKRLDEDGVSKNVPNKKTVAALRYSMKNAHKLKSFNSVDEMMVDLLAPDKKKKKSKK